MKKQTFVLVVSTLSFMLGQATVSDATPFSVTFDTSSISGGTYSLVFDLINGDGVSNNTVTLSSFAFGGGGPSGNPTLTGGSAGTLSTTVTLTDSVFLNEFMQDFTTGSVLSFTMDVLTNFGGGTPDSFSMSLLDSSGIPISTSDPLGTDVFLALDMTPSSSIQSFSSTSPQYPIPVPQIVANVPEPRTLFLFITGLFGLGYFGRKKMGNQWG